MTTVTNNVQLPIRFEMNHKELGLTTYTVVTAYLGNVLLHQITTRGGTESAAIAECKKALKSL